MTPFARDQATVEKAVQTKKTIIFLEDLIGNPTAKGMEECAPQPAPLDPMECGAPTVCAATMLGGAKTVFVFCLLPVLAYGLRRRHSETFCLPGTQWHVFRILPMLA